MARELTRGDQAFNRIMESVQGELEQKSRPSPIDSLPPYEALAVYEEQARLRFSPRKLRWRDVIKLDEEIGELEQRATTTLAELNETQTRLANADVADADALAGWLEAGSNGPRPELTKPGLERRRAELEAESAALAQVTDRAIKRKGDYVRKHRGRLAKLARQYVEAEQAKARRLIDELEATRDELAAAREHELWALTFGEEHAIRMPNTRLLCGDRRQPLERAGIRESVDAGRVLDAFRDDVEWLGRAATDEQRRLIEGERPPNLLRESVWSGTPEGEAAENAEKQRRRDEYEAAWGRVPEW